MTLDTTLLVNAALLSLTPAAFLVFLFRHAKRERIRERNQERSEEQRAEATMRLLEEKFRETNRLTAEGLTPLVTSVEQLRADVAALARSVEQLKATPPSSPEDPVAIEHQILSESWRQFRKNPELSAAFDDALQDRTWTQLLDQLTNVVPADLKSTFDAVAGPCREHRSLLQRIELIPRIVNGNLSRLTTDAEEIRRTRELATLLTSELAKVLDFRVKSWVTDSFLPFADLYLQRCQQAQLEKSDGEMKEGLSLVRQMLHVAAVEPIDVKPGETLFDSARHVGRSTSNDPRFPDGVITGVVRNGFIEGGQQVLRQPEVIVNRTR